MCQAADLLGWDYIGIADHSQSSAQANGMKEDRLFNQIEEIKKLNKSKKYRTHTFLPALNATSCRTAHSTFPMRF